jgi:hypothetical protein
MQWVGYLETAATVTTTATRTEARSDARTIENHGSYFGPVTN